MNDRPTAGFPGNGQQPQGQQIQVYEKDGFQWVGAKLEVVIKKVVVGGVEQDVIEIWPVIVGVEASPLMPQITRMFPIMLSEKPLYRMTLEKAKRLRGKLLNPATAQADES